MESTLLVVLFLSGTLSIALDFDQICSQKNYAVYVDGVCYKLYDQFQTSTSVITYCNQQGYQLATIRSADVVQGLMTVTNKYRPITANDCPGFFVQAPNGNSSNYLGMNITNSTDNTLSVNLKFNSTGKLPMIYWYGSNPHVAILTDNTDNPTYAFCEILPIYTQKGCGQALSSNTSFIVQSLEECVDKCSTYIWCAGVNFNWQQNLCQVLADNLSSKNMATNSSWSYFERS